MNNEDLFSEKHFFGISNKNDGLARYRKNLENWEDIRLMVRMRDNFTCQHCGVTEKEKGKALDVHHKNPFLKGEDSNPDNLIALCRSCHRKAEEKLK